MSIASAWKNCLNMTRLWQCSPVATRIGRPALRSQEVVGVPEPARRGDVRGIAIGQQLSLAFGPPRLGGAQQVEGFVRRERVGDVAEVDRGDEAFARQVGEVAPQRLAGAA